MKFRSLLNLFVTAMVVLMGVTASAADSLAKAAGEVQEWTFEWNKSKTDGPGFYQFTNATEDSLTATLNQKVWNITAVGTKIYAYTASMGQAVGKPSEPASHVSLWSEGFIGKVQYVKVKAKKLTGTEAALSVKVGNEQYVVDEKQSADLTTDFVEYTFVPATAGGSEGKIDVTIDQTSEKKSTLYFKSLTVAYQDYGTLNAPVFSLADGTYKLPQKVELTSEYSDASIYYTTDGSNPRVNGGSRKLYTEPISIDTTTICMAVVERGAENSAVAVANYKILRDPSLNFEKSEFSIEAPDNGVGVYLNNPYKVSPIRYESSDEDVAVIDKYGDIWSVQPGKVTVSAIFDGNEDFRADTATYELTVTKKTPLQTPTISPAGGEFNGPVTVTITAGDDCVCVWYSTTAANYDELTDDPTIVEGKTAEVTITKSCTLRVVAAGYNNLSEMAEAEFTINEDSGVNDVINNKKRGGKYYTIEGREARDGQKGLVITNGAKELRK